MQNERGLQSKASDNSRQHWEGGEFPMLCESCLGDNPYLRMLKNLHNGSCKICERPFTVFLWRPNKGEGFLKTEICQTCSKIKNICQTCLLDLQFGLPSQLRDAVLSQSTDGSNNINLSIPESDANREYFVSQQLAAIANGNDPWQQGETPNDKLLKLVRNVAVERQQGKAAIAALSGESESNEKRNEYAKTAGNEMVDPAERGEKEPKRKRIQNIEDKGEEDEILPPPGMSINEAQRALRQEQEENPAMKQRAPKPPKPPGPPPQWAFKKQKTGSTRSTSEVVSNG